MVEARIAGEDRVAFAAGPHFGGDRTLDPAEGFRVLDDLRRDRLGNDDDPVTVGENVIQGRDGERSFRVEACRTAKNGT